MLYIYIWYHNIIRYKKYRKENIYLGHIGDGDFHVNASCYKNEDAQKVKKIMDDIVYSYVKNSKGSISSEHGIG